MQQVRKTLADNQIKPHMTTVLFFRRENIEALPSPCCVPTQFQPLTVLYFHTGEMLCFVVIVYVVVDIGVVIDVNVFIDVDVDVDVVVDVDVDCVTRAPLLLLRS